jgi:hypothetical protein
VVWSTADKVPFFLASRLVGAVAPPPPPEERLPTPLELGEPGLIEGHVATAGFREIAVERHTLDYVVDPEKQWESVTAFPPPHLAAALQSLTPKQREQLHRDVIAALEPYRQGDRVNLPSEAIYVTAVR